MGLHFLSLSTQGKWLHKRVMQHRTGIWTGKGQYTLGDKLYQHVATTHCSNKSLHAYWIIFMKIFFSATEFCRRKKLHKFSLIMIFCNLLWRQRFLQKFSCTHKVICRCDVSLQHVAATSHATCTRARVICHLCVLLQLFTQCVLTLKTCKQYELMFSSSQNELGKRMLCNPTVQYLQTAFSVTHALFSATLLPCALIPAISKYNNTVYYSFKIFLHF